MTRTTRSDPEAAAGPVPPGHTDSARALGARLRAIREQRGWSLRDVHDASHGRFTGSAVGTYERGERGISVRRLSDLARLYGVPLERILPDSPVRHGGQGPRHAASEAGPEKVVIDLVALERQSEPPFGPVRRYIDAIKLRRGDFNGRVLSVRASDVWAMAAMAAVDPDTFISTLERLEVLRVPTTP
ncbi:MAG: helix-turn-helix domain-containing protein [Acidimicrobiia bacterium]|nr:helix-turn-helix domain-containing protein [Acidimicrobiia bacterium]